MHLTWGTYRGTLRVTYMIVPIRGTLIAPYMTMPIRGTLRAPYMTVPTGVYFVHLTP